MAQKKVWIVVGVVVVALITIKVIAALSSRVPKTVEYPVPPEMALPIENVAPFPDTSQERAVPMEQTMEQTATQPEPLLATPQTPAAPTATSSIPTVIEVQRALKNAGFDPGSVDGKLGKKTKAAIIEFQKANALTADGKVGPKTWSKLSRFLTVASSTQ